MGMLKIAIVLALSGLISFVAVPASACFNAIERAKERTTLKLRFDVSAANAASMKQIEKLQKKRDVRMGARSGVWKEDLAAVEAATDALNDGRNADVIVSMYDHFGLDINSWALNPKHVTDREREVVLLVSLAVLRTEGAVERHHKLVNSKPRRKVDNVRWAIRAIEGLAYMRFVPDRHLAEAWGRDDELKELATKRLLKLQKAGRLISPFQFDLLARLLREQGEPEHAQKIELAKLQLKD